MILGFTGTQEGMTAPQLDRVERYICTYKPDETHDGDCIGADDQFHKLVVKWLREVMQRSVVLIGHPPDNDGRRAFNTFDVERAPKYYTDRNKDIVNECEHMLATPRSVIHNNCRHGTCSTVRYAAKRNKSVTVILPDGSAYAY